MDIRLRQASSRLWGCILCLLLPLLVAASNTGQLHSVPIPAIEIDFANPPQGIFAEDWFEIHIGGQKVGYLTEVYQRDGDLILIRSHQVMRVGRGATTMEIKSRQETLESLAGQPLRVRQEIQLATQPLQIEAVFTPEGEVAITTRQGGAERTHHYPIGVDCVLSWGLQRKIIQWMQNAGGEGELRIFNPELSTESAIPAQIWVGAKEVQFDYLGKSIPGTPVKVDLQVGQGVISSEVWLDRYGRSLKTTVPMGPMQMDVYLVSSEQALKAFYPPEILVETLVPLSQPIPASADRVSFRISEDRASAEPLSNRLYSGPFHTVEALSDQSVRVQVYRQTSARRRAAPPQPTPSQVYLSANVLLNSADPLIVDLTEQALANKSGAGQWEQADILRQFVSNYVEDKNLEVGFASASEVARNPVGDCSEHAVLLAAMGRAAGIPSRVVAGLAYVDRFLGHDQVLGYHLWTQFWIDGQWVDFDAALAESECSPIRIALQTSSLEDSTLSDIGLGLIDSIGQIKIDVEAIDF